MAKRVIVTCDQCKQEIREATYQAVYHEGMEYAFHPACLLETVSLRQAFETIRATVYEENN